MKKDILILLIVVLAVQLLSPSYGVQTILWVLSGLIIAFQMTNRKVFLKVFLIEALIAITLVFLFKGETEFLKELSTQVNIPAFVFPVLFVLVNALTAAFAFQIGQSLKLIIRK